MTADGCQNPPTAIIKDTDECKKLESEGKLQKAVDVELENQWQLEVGRTEMESITSYLSKSRARMNVCSNSADKWANVNEGIKTLISELIPCSSIKNSDTGTLYYYRNTGKQITNCYGPEADKERMEDYFCCDSEIGQ